MKMFVLSNVLLVTITVLLLKDCSGQAEKQALFLQRALTANNSSSSKTVQIWKFLQFYSSKGRNFGDVSVGLAKLVNETLNGLSGSDSSDTVKCNNALTRMLSTPNQFLDAWGKPPPGVLYRDFHWIGSYQQCIRQHAPANKTAYLEPFSGQYCSSVLYQSKRDKKTNNETTASLPFRYPVKSLTIGICVPDTCTPAMLTHIINGTLQKLPTAPVEAYVYCQPTEKRQLTSRAACVIVLLSVVGAFIVAGTFYDLVLCGKNRRKSKTLREETQIAQEHDSGSNDMVLKECTPSSQKEPKETVSKKVDKELSVMGQLLICFSIGKNCKRLFRVAPSGVDSSPTLDAIHGIRFFSMSWIILGHTFFYPTIVGLKNLVIAGEVVTRFSFQAVLSSTVAVDSFFVISGLLRAFLTLQEMKNKGGVGKINWLLFYVHRYWRLTVPYMIILGVNAALFEYMGSGPLWPVVDINDNCRKSWWTNLLYVNNLVHTKERCFKWAWYLAIDMQFFWIIPLFLIPLFWKWWAGLAVCLVTLLVSLITTGVLSAYYGFPASAQGLYVVRPNLKQIAEGEAFDKIYVAPWCRIGPYILGVLCGYILYKTNSKVKMYWALNAIGWCIAAIINILVVYGLYMYTRKEVELNLTTEAFYNTVYRSAWGLGICWVIFACVTGYGGLVNKLLSWKVLFPLSRLTYMAYLVHPVVIFSYLFQQKYLFNYDDYSIIYLFLANMVLSYSVAFVAHLSFEAPFLALEKAAVGYVLRWQKSRPANSKHEIA